MSAARRVAALAAVLLTTACVTTQEGLRRVPGTPVDDPEVRAQFARSLGCAPEQLTAERWDGVAAAIGCGWYGYFEREASGTWKRTAFAQLDSDTPVPRQPGMSGARHLNVPNDLITLKLLKSHRGVFRADCVLTREGRLTDCEVTRSVSAAADAHILGKLAEFRFEPATYAGHTFAIQHTMIVRVQPP